MKTNNKHYTYNAPFTMKDKEGNLYNLKIEQDDMADSPRAWDNVTTMVCWHNRYTLGDKHNYNDIDDFCDDMINLYISNNELYEFVLQGNAKDAKIEEDNLYGRLSEKHEWYKVDICLTDDVPDTFAENILAQLYTYEKVKLLYEIKDIAILPLYLYDHSGITISTGSFGDKWDSGQVGFVYMEKEIAFKQLRAYVKDENGERIKEEYKHEGYPSTWGYKTIALTEDNWKERAIETIEAEVKTYDQYLTGEVYGFVLEKKEIIENRCPHYNELISTNEEWIEEDSCWGFYGDCLEDNGILDNISSNLEFIE